MASQNGHVEVVDKLLQHGASADLQAEVRLWCWFAVEVKGKNQIGCRDDTVPKTLNTCTNLQQPQKTYRLELRKIVACFQYTLQCLLASTIFGILIYVFYLCFTHFFSVIGLSTKTKGFLV